MKEPVNEQVTLTSAPPSGAMPPPYQLLYDGDCGLCRRFVDWLASRDRHGRLQLAAYQDVPLSGQDRARAERSLQLVGPQGRREQRGRAVLQAVALTGSVSTRWLQIPPVIYLIDLVYCWVAKHREWVSKWIHHRER